VAYFKVLSHDSSEETEETEENVGQNKSRLADIPTGYLLNTILQSLNNRGECVPGKRSGQGLTEN
jgi:hypothetical protein